MHFIGAMGECLWPQASQLHNSTPMVCGARTLFSVALFDLFISFVYFFVYFFVQRKAPNNQRHVSQFRQCFVCVLFLIFCSHFIPMLSATSSAVHTTALANDDSPSVCGGSCKEFALLHSCCHCRFSTFNTPFHYRHHESYIWFVHFFLFSLFDHFRNEDE